MTKSLYSVVSRLRHLQKLLKNAIPAVFLLLALQSMAANHSEPISSTRSQLTKTTKSVKKSPTAARIVTGQVMNDKAESMAGVSVVEKGTSNGTTTKEDGTFTITVTDDNAVLVFSTIGYKSQEVAVKSGGASFNLTVVLSSVTAALDEVVVVAYGTQKKVNLTGAVATIDNQILEDRPVSRLSQALQGAVANLNIMTEYGGGAPNATQSLNVRGFTGFGTTGSPLVVIDGVQAGDFNALNPSDIENISVIKDASAAAIYGSSAPYGVILITTKKGKAGKVSITYNGGVTVNTPIGLPKMMNSLDFATIYNEAGYNAGYGTNNYFSDELIQRMKDYQAGVIKDETRANPNAGQDQWLSWFGANSNNDWFKIFYKDAQVLQQHNLGVSGGTEKSRFFVGLGYNDRPGMYRYGNDLYKRYNIRANFSSKLTDWLEFALRTSYSKESYNGPWAGGNRTGGNWMHQLARKHPNIPMYNPNGEYAETSDIPYQLNGGRRLESWDKPLITGELTFTPIKGWSTTVNYTYDANIFNISNHVKTLYQTLPSGKLGVLDWTSPNSFSRNLGIDYHNLLNLYSSYETTVKKHYFKLLGGYVSELNNNLRMNGGNNYLYTDNVPSISTTYGTTPSVSDGRSQLASLGYFGRLNYNFDEKYLLEVSGRYDATSRFLAANRWRFYPGMSAGWNVHREKFWDELGAFSQTINTLKIRGSYGSLGDQVADFGGNWYPFYPSLGTTPATNTNWYFNSGREAGTFAPGLVDPTVTWVTTTTLDFGLDLTALRNRFGLTFDWYKRSADDFLGSKGNYPAILGASPPLANVLGMETKGFELTLSWKDRVGDLAYNIRGTLSNYRGVVTKYPNDLKLLNQYFPGREMGVIYGFETVGYYTSYDDVAQSPDQSYIYSKWGPGDIKYKDLNNDGKINIGSNRANDMGDLKVIGNSTPKYQYGLYTDLTWKDFDGSFFFQGVAKRDIWTGSNYFWGVNGSEWQSSPFTVHNDRWTPSTPDGYFPKFYMSGENGKNQQTQTKYLQSAAYLRLKNIQLGYTLPHSLLGKLSVQKFRVYAMIENVFTLSPLKKHSTLDPETFFSDMKIYPLQRSYSFGLNITL